jgi:hypothetical protein
MIKNLPENQSLFPKTTEQKAITEEVNGNSSATPPLELLANILETRINGTAA